MEKAQRVRATLSYAIEFLASSLAIFDGRPTVSLQTKSRQMSWMHFCADKTREEARFHLLASTPGPPALFTLGWP